MNRAEPALGPLGFAVIVGAAVWGFLHWATPTAPTTVGAPIPASGDPEVRLCDRAVEALLHSNELIEVERAAAIIREVNCGIGKRL